MARIEKRTVKGHNYWYLVESYRNEQKQPRSRVLEYLGNTAAFVAWFNKKIKENVSTSVITVKSYEHGTMRALHRMADKLDIAGILGEAFPTKTRKEISRTTVFLACSFQRACHPGSNDAEFEWCKFYSDGNCHREN
jgi:hypothetical protein